MWHSLPARDLETEMSTAPTDYKIVRELCGPRNYLYVLLDVDKMLYVLAF